MQYRYVETGLAMPETWNDMQITKSGNSYYASADFTISNFNRNIAYSFEVKAADKLESATGSAVGIKSLPVFHWSESDFAFEVPVKIQGSPITDFVVEQGTTEIWTYRKWNSGIAECWGFWQEEGIAIKTPQRGAYMSALMTETLPFVFYGTSIISGHVSNSMWFGNTWVSSGTNTLNYTISRVTEADSDSCDIRMFIIGKWK